MLLDRRPYSTTHPARYWLTPVGQAVKRKPMFAYTLRELLYCGYSDDLCEMERHYADSRLRESRVTWLREIMSIWPVVSSCFVLRRGDRSRHMAVGQFGEFVVDFQRAEEEHEDSSS